MSDHLSVERIKQLLGTLFEAIAQRVEGELSLKQDLAQNTAIEQENCESALQARTEKYESERDALQVEYDQECAVVGRHFHAHHSAVSEEYDEALLAVNSEYDQVTSTAKQEFDETKWMVMSYFDETSAGTPKQQFEQFETNIASTQQHLEVEWANLLATKDGTEALLKKRRMWSEGDPVQAIALAANPTLDTFVESFSNSAAALREHAQEVKSKSLPFFYSGVMPVIVFLAGAATLTAMLLGVVDFRWFGFQTKPPSNEWTAIMAVVASMLTALIQWIMYAVAHSAAERDSQQLRQLIVNAEFAKNQWNKLAMRETKRRKKEFEDWLAEITAERDAALGKAQDKLNAILSDANAKRARGLKDVNDRYPRLMNAQTQERDQKLAVLHADYPDRLAKLKSRYEWDLNRIRKDAERKQDELRHSFDINWQSMSTNWFGAIDSLHSSVDRLRAETLPISKRWNDLAYGAWSRPDHVPSALRLGEVRFSLSDIEHGYPTDEELAPESADFAIPALLPFPEQTSLVVRATGTQGRAAAVKILQVAMLRLLTTLPPGKIRFTIIDPIGLGQDFSAFMHLADYDELLVTKRIWTEQTHIDQRLADLTEHMETVFQTYLRNEFKTIEEYNEFAGEVAEPYHVLVIAGFPANFSEQAGRRLTSIITSGPKCGLYTLISVDTDLSLPPNFQIDSLTDNARCISWNGQQFLYDDPELQWLPLQLDELPEPEAYGRIVKNVGDASKDARRVEVSFDRVAPKTLWQSDSRGGLDVPLGRAGATKLQHMRLGKGTSQHVLVAGKTGSGKSTLMHILITNLALHYSPDEVEFYLIDFKKGVEFKTYAAHRLPHARVIAIESDREFGMSVLERLDQILKERGDLFRDQGVQDIAGFRNANPGVRMPRMLLLVDEFQEFFVEDDKLSQNSALLLDRLVRQGRAFGIHVLLGSQTLGGAYSLARSTLGQVAVRIALQCSEADAHLILSEDNTAARLLTRPGEAIYNDANGLLEGNHPFQIAWLEDSRRDVFLDRIKDYSDEQNVETDPPIVFEGNIPANPLNNAAILNLLRGDVATNFPKVIDAWLGEAVAIKPHTTVRFRRLSGSNLLIVGQSPQSARGILSTLMLGLGLQIPPIADFGAMLIDDEEELISDKSAPHSPLAPMGRGAGGEGQPPSSLHSSTTSSTESPQTQSDSSALQPNLDALKNFSFANFSFGATETPATRPTVEPIEDVSAAQFYILNGDLADDPDHNEWEEIVEEFPHQFRHGGPAESAQIINELSQIVRARASGSADAAAPVFLLIDNLGRFRDLRKGDDDYSFSASAKASNSPSKQLADLLKDGPAVGVHTLVWCDTFNNLGRWLASSTLKELEMRVAFQMSGTDSSNLIDTPIAAKLGPNRAILFLEEHGSTEKFRPYGLLSDETREQVAAHYEVPELISASDDDFVDEDDSADADGEVVATKALDEDDDLDACGDLSPFTIV